MKRTVLAIEDKEIWLGNFRAAIPEEFAILDGALTSNEAKRLLRIKHYDVVLLDLSMTSDHRNRDNESIQDYLALGEEQTKYIIISGTIRTTEIRDSAYRRNAFDIIFKDEAEPDLLRERVTAAFEAAGDWRGKFLPSFRRTLLQTLETDLVSVLKPRGGVAGLSSALEHLAGHLAPIAPHTSRRALEIRDGIGVGLIWSRQRGEACSVALAREAVSAEDLKQRVSAWLGFDSREALLPERRFARLHIQCYREPDISDEYFDLPKFDLS